MKFFLPPEVEKAKKVYKTTAIDVDDETKEIAKEIVRCDALNRVFIALDFFDASINRILAWSVGLRSLEKALLMAMLTPWDKLKKLQDENRLTELMSTNEAVKMLPFGDIWDYYCEKNGVVTDLDLYGQVEKYEKNVLMKRGN